MLGADVGMQFPTGLTPLIASAELCVECPTSLVFVISRVLPIGGVCFPTATYDRRLSSL